MTGAQNSLRKLKERHQMLLNLREDIEELEGDLQGLELKYEGHYATTVCVDIKSDYVLLYVDEDNGNEYEVDLTIDELEELL